MRKEESHHCHLNSIAIFFLSSCDWNSHHLRCHHDKPLPFGFPCIFFVCVSLVSCITCHLQNEWTKKDDENEDKEHNSCCWISFFFFSWFLWFLWYSNSLFVDFTLQEYAWKAVWFILNSQDKTLLILLKVVTTRTWNKTHTQVHTDFGRVLITFGEKVKLSLFLSDFHDNRFSFLIKNTQRITNDFHTLFVRLSFHSRFCVANSS